MPNAAEFQFNTSRATFMNNLYDQVLGSAGAISNLNTSDEITQYLVTGMTTPVYDPLMTALSQMVGRTLMAVRPFKSKLNTIEVTNEEYGWITRKMSFIEDPVQQNLTFTLTDGQSIDPWVVNKPKVFETQRYGGGQISRVLTIYEDQIKGAFQSRAALDNFLSGTMTWFNSMVEMDREQYKRTALLNYMGALSQYPDRCIYLIDEYNSATGSALDATTVFAPANFEGFTQWLYGFIQKLMGLLSERSFKYHLNPTSSTLPVYGYIARQTRYEDMRCFLNTGFKEDMTARVVANTFNKEELKEVKYEGINFWQSIDDPTDINVRCELLDNAWYPMNASVSLQHVFGVIFDRDALAVSYMNDNTGNSPYNTRGRYYNIIHNSDVSIVQDLSENGILLILDKAP